MTTGTILTIVALVTLLITAAAAVGGSFRVSRNTATVNLYRENAKAWEEKAQVQEVQITDLQQEKNREVAELQSRLEKKDREVAELQARLAQLEEIVTGRALIEKLSVDMHAKWAEVLGQVSEMRGEVRENGKTLAMLVGKASAG